MPHLQEPLPTSFHNPGGIPEDLPPMPPDEDRCRHLLWLQRPRKGHSREPDQSEQDRHVSYLVYLSDLPFTTSAGYFVSFFLILS
jgi:hypothetical protein